MFNHSSVEPQTSHRRRERCDDDGRLGVRSNSSRSPGYEYYVTDDSCTQNDLRRVAVQFTELGERVADRVRTLL